MPQSGFACFHAGQVCANYSRWLIPRSRYDEAIEMMAAAFKAVKFGDPMDPANIQGPQISARQRERVLAYIDQAQTEGAVLVTGGGRPPALEGLVCRADLFSHVDNAMTIAREEVFGPVLVAIPFEDDVDAVRIANDSRYGLVAAVTQVRGEGPECRISAQSWDHQHQRGYVFRTGRALRRLQGERHRTAEWHRRFRVLSQTITLAGTT